MAGWRPGFAGPLEPPHEVHGLRGDPGESLIQTMLHPPTRASVRKGVRGGNLGFPHARRSLAGSCKTPPSGPSMLAGMEQRISLITLGVRDLPRARDFYEALGWRGAVQPDDEVVFFQAGGMVL